MNTNSEIQRFKIIKEKTKIYESFTQELLSIIVEYYLDKKTLTNETDIKNHYNWCYIKTCDKFINDGYNFYYNNKLKDYFYIYYYENIYTSHKFDSKENVPIKLFSEFWKKIFDITTIKDKNFITILGEIYKIFDKSYNNIIISDENNNNEIKLEKDKINIITENFDKNKFNKIFEFKYSNKTIALAESKSNKLIFIDNEGNENVTNFSDEDIYGMDSYIRAIYYNQLLKNRLFYTVSQFIYSDNSLAEAETIKGKMVYINKKGEITKLNKKNK